ncbi:hyalin-like [Anneissia japonica]|uniref:hyalin-like n=1 Tax=Anneissia japonica TaxID=1529436 RepID=UPI001425B85E|nr:hyalin-like [Anneissia japonica]
MKPHNEDPVITFCPNNITVNTTFRLPTAIVPWNEPIAEDNSGRVNFTVDIGPASTFQVGDTLVTYTAEDPYGNTDMCSFTITVQDNEVPIIYNCPNDTKVNTTFRLPTANVSWTEPIAEDNSGRLNLTVDIEPASTFQIGDTLVTYTAEDPYGNTAMCSFTITVEDKEPPVPICPSLVSGVTDLGKPNGTVSYNISIMDNVQVHEMFINYQGANQKTLTINQTYTVVETTVVLPIGETEIEHIFIDSAFPVGNEATCYVIVAIEDNEDPVITFCPNNITVNTTFRLPTAIVSWNEPIAEDNSGRVNFTVDIGPASTFLVGDTLVTYTAEDPYGNTDMCSFTITVQDKEPPVISCPTNVTSNNYISEILSIIYVKADEARSYATVTWDPPITSDNSNDNVTVVAAPYQSGGMIPVTTSFIQIVYTATDDYENADTCEFAIQVLDKEPPVPICPSQVSGVTDLGKANGTVSYNISIMDNVQVHEMLAFPVGNEATCYVIVAIEDNEDPVITFCPNNITVNTTFRLATAIVSWNEPIAEDNSGRVNFTVDIGPASTFQVDKEPPVISCPTNVTSNNYISEMLSIIYVKTDEGRSYATVTLDPPITSDNSNDNVTVVAAPYQSGGMIPVTTSFIQIVYTATDDYENADTCEFAIQVLVSWNEPIAGDNSGRVNFTVDIGPASTFQVGDTLVTYTAEDPYGNTDMCSFTITVQDKEPPVISCPTNVTSNNYISEMLSIIYVKTDEGRSYATVTLDPPITSDNSNDNVTVVAAPYQSGGMIPVTTSFIQIVYTATDDYENADTCEFAIQVLDNEEPIIYNCPNDTKVNTTFRLPTANVSWTEPIAEDNSGRLNLTVDIEPASTFQLGDTLVTYTVEDPYGNTAMCSFTVTVEDEEDPVITGCPDDVVFNTTNMLPYTNATWIAPTATDNSGNVTLSSTNDPGTGFMCIRDRPYTNATWIAPTATDNSGNVTLSSTNDPGTGFARKTTTVVYIATDPYGNQADCSFNVTVTDPEMPWFMNCPMDIDIYIISDLTYTNVTWKEPIAFDNSGHVDVAQTAYPGDGFGVGTHTVLYTAMDKDENSANCSFTITVLTAVNVFSIGLTLTGINGNLVSYTSHLEDPTSERFQETESFVCSVVQHSLSSIIGSSGCKVLSFADGSIIANIEIVTSDPDITGIEVESVLRENAMSGKLGNAGGLVLTVYPSTINYFDNEPPVAICPTNVTSNNYISELLNVTYVKTDESSPYATVTWDPPITSDNSNANVTVVVTPYRSGDMIPLTTSFIQIVFTATDVYGNSDSCELAIQVLDTEKPNLICPDNVVSVSDTDKSVSWNEPEPQDNSGLAVTLTASASPDDAWEIGERTVTYTATDMYGNVDTCSFQVTVIDACFDKECQNGGICHANNGLSECICPSFYGGEYCENEPDSPSFSVSLASNKADLNAQINLTCNVFYSNDWQWYKDDVPLISTLNLYVLSVTMTIDNQGYYTCGGFGAGPYNNTEKSSESVSLIVNGVLIFPASMTFNYEFDVNLNDPSSTTFKELSANISDFLTKDLSLNGDVAIQIRDFSVGSVVVGANFYVLNTNDSYVDLLATLNEEVIRIANDSNGILIPSSIVISSTETCYKERYGKYQFPSAGVGDTVDSKETCPYFTVNYLLPGANRTCNGNGFSAATWNDPVETNCGSNATAEKLLKRITEMNVTADNVEMVSSEVEEITSKTEEITVEALESTADILNDILNLQSDSPEVTGSVVSIVNNLFSVDDEILMKSQMEDKAPTKIIEALEQQLTQVDLGDSGMYNVTTTNLAVQAQNIDVDSFSQENNTYFSFISESSEIGVGSIDLIEDSETIPNAATVSIALPVSISDVIRDKNMKDFRVVVIVYNDSTLFQSSQFDPSSRRPNSQVISLSVPDLGLDHFELNESIVTTFIPLEVGFCT